MAQLIVPSLEACGMVGNKHCQLWEDKFNDKHGARHEAPYKGAAIRGIEVLSLSMPRHIYTLAYQGPNRHLVVIEI